MRRIAAHSSPSALAKIDGRTVEAKLLARTRADLVAHVGGHPSATQQMLIERACHLTLRIAAMDRRLSRPGQDVEGISKSYLAWSNTLARTLRQLGMKAAPARPPTLAELMAQPHAGAAA